MTLHVFESTDPGAPQLDSSYGALNNLLYACLVTGYGAKAGAGWTREFNDDASKTMVFRQPVASKSRCYLQVQDNDTGSTGKCAQVRAYEAMTAYNAGTNPFPVSDLVYFWKSGSASIGTYRPWFLFADQERFYLLVDHSSGGYVLIHAFGDLIPDVGLENDVGRCVLIGNPSNSLTTSSTVFSSLTTHIGNNSGVAGSAVQRTYTGEPTPIRATGLSIYSVTAGNTVAGNSSIPYPYPTDGSLRAYPFLIGEYVSASIGYIRGKLPGLWIPLHNRPLAHLATIDGAGGLAGRSFRMFYFLNTGSGGCYLMETSDTWN